LKCLFSGGEGSIKNMKNHYLEFLYFARKIMQMLSKNATFGLYRKTLIGAFLREACHKQKILQKNKAHCVHPIWRYLMSKWRTDRQTESQNLDTIHGGM
jgi:hypothetical protein